MTAAVAVICSGPRFIGFTACFHKRHEQKPAGPSTF
jgi:hypothetical protein